ncbi:MAG: slipin family protein [Verrucomicrobiales bacterium]|nr:slipin family protein [Verrucomicrobiales bacterium]
MKEAIYIIAILIALIIWAIAIRGVWNHYSTVITIWDYQVGLHFRHGKFVGELKAGKHRLWGAGHEMITYDIRISELVVQGQEVITADCATLKLTAVARWKIVDAAKFHASTDDPRQAIYTVIQLALRQLFGGVKLDEIVEKKNAYGDALLELARTGTTDLGIEIGKADIRDVMLGGDLKTAYTAVLTAKKESLAQLEKARGDTAALRTLANAARLFEKNPDLFRLKYLETLKDAGTGGYGNTLVIGVPEELAPMALAKK